MKKYIVLSVNDNPDYLFFTPLTVWAWRKLGWEVIVMFHNVGGINSDCVYLVEQMEQTDEAIFKYLHVEGHRSSTITQVSRLYAGCLTGDDVLLMTSDIDLIPLSDYWHPDPSKITVYGEDLTGYTEYPISYLAMTKQRWVEVMGLTSSDYNELIKRDLDNHPNSKSDDFYKWWGIDQQIITERIKAVNFEKQFINRGQYANGYAIGRPDRGAWTLNHKQYIDAHLFHQMYHKGREQYFEKTLDLLYHIWPDDDFGWLVSYTHKFRQLTGHA